MLNKTIELKEEDESVKNDSISLLEFANRLIEHKFDSATQQLEEVQMKYDEINTVYEILEPEVARLSIQNQEFYHQNGTF